MTTRVVEKVSLSRLAAEDPAKLKPWLEDWAKTVANYRPNQVWNVDETGSFLGYSDKATKVVTLRGTQVVRRPQAEQRQWVTTVGGASATGVKLPPTFLFRSPVQQVVEKGFLALRTPKGWTTTEAWLEFLKWEVTQALKVGIGGGGRGKTKRAYAGARVSACLRQRFHCAREVTRHKPVRPS